MAHVPLEVMWLEVVNLRDPGIEILLDFGGFGAKLGLIMLKIVFDPLAATGLAQQLAIELGAPAEVKSEIAECAVVGGSMPQRLGIGQGAIEIGRASCRESECKNV